MKMKITLNRISATLFMFALFVVGLNAQQSDNQTDDYSLVLEKPLHYNLTYTPKNQTNDDLRTLNLVSNHPGVEFQNFLQIGTGGFCVEVIIPTGVPLSSAVSLIQNNWPLWHVTVADILGNSESNDEVNLRPVETISQEEGQGTGNPNAISDPNTGNIPVSGIQGTKSTPKMDIFPNPAVEEINIVTEGEVLWGVSEVIDLTGKRVAVFPTGASAPAAGVQKQTINLSGIKAGIYILRFKTDKESYARRFQIIK